MLKNMGFLLMVAIAAFGCRSGEKTPVNHETKRDTLPVFPVTDYLLGQLATIEALPTTPVQIFKTNGNPDSVWIKREDVRRLAAPFLQPTIDSASLQKYFTGNSFLDQTIGAFTFTYIPKPAIENTTGLRELNVYVDPASNKVQRIYIVKEKGDTTIQLTWKSAAWFSIRSIVNDKVNEEIVKWKFDD